VLIGAAMGATAIGIYSPIGQRSGAHFNPAVTFIFGDSVKRPWDAIFYSLSVYRRDVGVILSAVMLGMIIDPTVNYASLHRPTATIIAFLAGVIISFCKCPWCCGFRTMGS
jgi:aquaporin Z